MRLELTLGDWLKAGTAAAAALWCSTPPLLQLLLTLMVIDMLTGILAAIYNRELDSSISFRGVCKKAIALLVVAAGAALEPNVGLPVADTIAGFYCAGELISVIENAARAGLPVPDIVRDVLLKLNPKADVEPRRT